MNVNDYTEKSLYAIQNAQNRALEEGNSIIDAEHLLVTEFVSAGNRRCERPERVHVTIESRLNF